MKIFLQAIILFLIVTSHHLNAQFNNNLYFDGSTEEVITAGTIYELKPSIVTLEFWIKPFDISSMDEVVRNLRDSGGHKTGFGIVKSSGGDFDVQFYVGVPGNGKGNLEVRTSPAVTLSANTWNHISATYDGNKVTIIHFDGLNSNTVSNSFNQTKSIAYHGQQTSGVRIGEKGGVFRLDELRLWNKAISSDISETLKNYELEKRDIDTSVYGVNSEMTPSEVSESSLNYCDDLMIYYKFNDSSTASGSTSDSSCHGINGTFDPDEITDTNIGDPTSTGFAKWIGTEDGVWSNENNWENQITPSEENNVIIIDTDATIGTDPIAFDSKIEKGVDSYYDIKTIYFENTNNVDGAKANPTLTLKKIVLSETSSITIPENANITITDRLDVKGNITLKSTAKLSIGDVDGGLANTGTITLESNENGTASLIIDAVESNGIVQVERYVAFDTYADFSSPTASTSAVFLGHQLYRHIEQYKSKLNGNGSGNPYVLVDDTNLDLNPMEGYNVHFDSDNLLAQNRKITFNGNINTGIQSFLLTNTDSGGGEYYGWNLIGNPYTSAISWDLIISDLLSQNPNLSSTIYINNGANKDWVVYNPSLAIANEDPSIETIPLGQAFFIHLMGTQSSFNAKLNSSHQVHSTDNVIFGRLPSTPTNAIAKVKKRSDVPEYYFEIHAINKQGTDKSYYHWRDEATNDYDPLFDSEKFLSGNPNDPNIYFTTDNNNNNNNRFSILQDNKRVLIDLNYYSSLNSEVEISINNNNTFDSVVLEDKLEGTFTNLLESNYYFYYEKYQRDRFKIHISSNTLSSSNLNDNNFFFFNNSEGITIKSKTTINNCSVNIIDISGRNIFHSIKESTAKELNIPINLNRGFYIVKIDINDQSVSKKIIID